MDLLRSPSRLDALRRTGLLDSPPEEAFDRLTRLAAATLGVPVALVSLVDCDRQFFKSCIGLDEPLATAREVPLSYSFCQYVVASGEPFIVDDARSHPVVACNPSVSELGVGAYAGVPLMTSVGETLGALCVTDSRPRRWSRADVRVLEDLAAAAMTEIELRAAIADRMRVEQEREQLVRALELERHRLESLFEQAPAFIAAARGPEHRFEMANEAYYRLVGRRDIIGRPVAEAIPEAAEHGLVHVLDRVLATGEPFRAHSMRLQLRRTPGQEPEERYLDFVYQPLVEADGSRSGIFCHGVDVTEQVRATNAERESAERYRLLFDSNPLPLWVYALDTLRFVAVNDAAILHYGYSRDEFLSMTILDIRPPAAAEFVRASARSVGSGETRLQGLQHRRRDGTLLDVEVTSRPILFAGHACRLVLAHDVTERSRAERALRASEERYRSFVESAHEGVWALDMVGRTTYVNPRMAELLGYPIDAMMGTSLFDFMDPRAAFEARTLFARRQRGIAESHSFAFRRADGTELWTMLTASPLRGPDGEFAGALALVSDITERRRAEAELRERDARLRLALDAASMVVWERNLRTDVVQDRGVAAGEPEGGRVAAGTFPSYAAFLAAVHPDDREQVARANAGAVANARGFSAEYRIARSGGTYRWAQTTGRVFADAAGRPERMIGVTRDVTERIALEMQLRQAQKMEAVGQLAGGVAHDFNNLLTVITGGVALARESLPPDAAALEELDAVEGAARRAAALTRQLLAFSRQQVLRPELVDLNRILCGLESMLRRLIGEDITIVVAPRADPAVVMADPGQIEQVLINLAVNARDAMPGGGRLTFETANAQITTADAVAQGDALAPGEYVRLRVRDTGTGMDETTLAHAFEPFFTTKEASRGTGLGLATVYGIVTQSGGCVRASSAVGAGTTFEIHLPAAAAAAVLERELPLPPPAAASGTVLLVEDDEAVRTLARRVLARHGYSVIEAASGPEALGCAGSHAGRIDLVITDMVMPEMDGRAFAERFARMSPHSAVLFVSGYTDDEIIRRGLHRPGTAFLQKPYTPERLLDVARSLMHPA